MLNLRGNAFRAFCWTAISAGVELIIDFFGVRTVIENTLPILKTFLPFIGIFIILIAIRFLVDSAKNSAIHDLEEIQVCGEKLTDWANQNPLENKPPRAQSRLRQIVLWKKYKNWIKNNPKGSIEHIVLGAAECAEILRAHGYVVGRFMIWKSNRDWKKKIAHTKNGDL